MSMPQFVDLCILTGCDYLPHIRGVGASTAYKHIATHGSLDGFLKRGLPKEKKVVVPEDWDHARARALFESPPVVDPKEAALAVTPPDYEALKTWLIEKHSFAESRVAGYVKRLRKVLTKKPQARIDGFFAKSPTQHSSARAKKETKLSKLVAAHGTRPSVKRSFENIDGDSVGSMVGPVASEGAEDVPGVAVGAGPSKLNVVVDVAEADAVTGEARDIAEVISRSQILIWILTQILTVEAIARSLEDQGGKEDNGSNRKRCRLTSPDDVSTLVTHICLSRHIDRLSVCCLVFGRRKMPSRPLFARA